MALLSCRHLQGLRYSQLKLWRRPGKPAPSALRLSVKPSLASLRALSYFAIRKALCKNQLAVLPSLRQHPVLMG